MKKLIFILLLCITTSAFGQLRQKPMHGLQINKAHQLGDPVAFWPFNEGSGNIVQDLSGNGKNGIITGAVWIPGKYGSALDFTGGGKRVDSSDSTNLSGSFTFVTWVKTDNWDTGGGALNTVIASEVSSYSNYWAYLGGTGGGLTITQFGLYDGTNNPKSAYASTPVNEWVQLVGVRDVSSDSLLFYVNGILQGTVEDTTTSVPVYEALNFGQMEEITSRDFHGQIDHVLIYSRALSASEIAQLYREPFCMFEGDLTVAQMYDYSGAPPAPSSQFITIQMSVIPLFVIILIAISPVFRKWKSKYSMMENDN